MYRQMEDTDNEHFEEDEVLKQKSIKELRNFIKSHGYIRLTREIGEKIFKGSILEL